TSRAVMVRIQFGMLMTVANSPNTIARAAILTMEKWHILRKFVLSGYLLSCDYGLPYAFTQPGAGYCQADVKTEKM
ncbi:MAG: hypothetical protein OXD44_01150, partial [Gammaproteobacteria bacterium]|nr:hypothetical protein [Gammaproteobacteria bacterium]